VDHRQVRKLAEQEERMLDPTLATSVAIRRRCEWAARVVRTVKHSAAIAATGLVYGAVGVDLDGSGFDESRPTGRLDVHGLTLTNRAVWIADNRSGYLYRVLSK
jgi:hypothetical protein